MHAEASPQPAEKAHADEKTDAEAAPASAAEATAQNEADAADAPNDVCALRLTRDAELRLHLHQDAQDHDEEPGLSKGDEDDNETIIITGDEDAATAPRRGSQQDDDTADNGDDQGDDASTNPNMSFNSMNGGSFPNMSFNGSGDFSQMQMMMAMQNGMGANSFGNFPMMGTFHLI